MIVVTCAFFTVFVCSCAYKLLRPLPKLENRLSPYDTVVRVRLDRSSTSLNYSHYQSATNSNIFIEFARPVYEPFLKVFSKLVTPSDTETTTLKLIHAGLETDLEKYRTNIIKRVLIFCAAGLIVGAAIGNVISLVIFPVVFGFSAISKSKGALEKLINNRRRIIRSELYTIDQLLALHIRTGSGVSQALMNISQRTNGIISNDLREILKRVRTGMSIDESLYLAAKNTPEPHAMRTYKLLAAASHRGVDLTHGLLDLAKDLRRTLREDIKATGTKRRAAMLLPTIGILAPIMLLFVAAPIPSIVLAGN